MKILRVLVLIALAAALAVPAAAFDRRTPVVLAVAADGPAVVNVRTEQIVRRSASPLFGFSDPFFDQFFQDMAPTRAYQTESLGSGVIIDPRGYVLTNAHVIEKASKIYVAVPGQTKELQATLVGKDDWVDLAVLKLEGKGPFPALKPGRSDDLMEGETVIAIGNPLGLGHSVTTGVVSAPNRRINMGQGEFTSFIQTDALINPGNSGGPLLNINGKLIGVNTAIIKQAQGIGFSIPIDTVKRVLHDLMAYGHLRPAYLGILPGAVNKAFAQARGAGGVLVDRIDPESPAAKAGMHVADVVLAVDGSEVDTPQEYRSLLRSYTPDNTVNLDVLRGTKTLRVALRCAVFPPNYGLNYCLRVFGFTVAPARGGVTIASVAAGSPAARVGLRQGDLVTAVAGARIGKPADLNRGMIEQLGKKPLRFTVFRGNQGYYVDLP